MGEFHLLGGGSPIAQLLAKKLDPENKVISYSSSGQGRSYDCFLSSNLNGSVVIYFCNIRDNVQANINLLDTFIQYCKKFNCKLIFISSINAEVPSASLYSKTKHECEKIVSKHGYNYIRLAIVVSDPPFSSYRALKNLHNLPIKFRFHQSQYIHFTEIEDFLNLDFESIDDNMNLYSSSIKLNEFFDKNRFTLFQVNIEGGLSILRKINKNYPLRSMLGRLLTITAFNRDYME